MTLHNDAYPSGCCAMISALTKARCNWVAFEPVAALGIVSARDSTPSRSPLAPIPDPGQLLNKTYSSSRSQFAEKRPDPSQDWDAPVRGEQSQEAQAGKPHRMRPYRPWSGQPELSENSRVSALASTPRRPRPWMSPIVRHPGTSTGRYLDGQVNKSEVVTAVGRRQTIGIICHEIITGSSDFRCYR